MLAKCCGSFTMSLVSHVNMAFLLQMAYNTVQDVMVTQASALCILHRELPCTGLTRTQ